MSPERPPRSPSWRQSREDERQSALLQYDLGQATYAMTVAAADLGVGTGHAAAADQDQARAILG